MRALIRFVRPGPAGAIELKDKLYEGETVTLGRATDQVVQFKDRRVALAHAFITVRGGQPVLVSRVPVGVLVNGSLQRETTLKPGDTLSIGANLLRVFAAPDGCDLAFSFELDPDARSDEVALELPRLRLAELGLSKRRWSWGLFLGVLLLTLLIPAAGVRSPVVQDTLRSGPLPDDHFWSPGPLSRVHALASTKCETCHAKPFQRVRNDACLACHESHLRQHSRPTMLVAAVPNAAGVAGMLDGMRCANCHAEHKEPAALVRDDPQICLECHRDLGTVAPSTRVSAHITDFAVDHPEFSVVSRDNSGLKFSHESHLDKDGVRSPVGDTVLGCVDCHAPVPGSSGFRAVQMERDCGSCHLLDFDPAHPDRTVPHGDSAAITEFLVDYYSRRFLEGYADSIASPVVARRAGAKPSAVERERLLRDAREQAAAVTRDVFERRSCVECHELRKVFDDAATPWAVQPVEIAANWLPASAFSHAVHGTTLTTCDSCHRASSSGVATDVLMPAIATCRECHAGAEVLPDQRNRVTSTCVLCHGFHNENQPLWSRLAEGR